MMSLDGKAFMDWAYTVSSGGGPQAAMTAYLAMRKQIGGGSEDNSNTSRVESRVFEANDKRFTVSMGSDGYGKLKIDDRAGNGWLLEFERADLGVLTALLREASTMEVRPTGVDSMKRCEHCKVYNYAAAKFCSHCGKPFDAVPAAGVEQSPVTPGPCTPAKPSIKPVIGCPSCGGLNDADNPR